MINFIHIILFTLVSAKTNEEELKEAACVIFSRYILQIQSSQASPPIGKLIKEQNYDQVDAIYIVQAAALDKCLINIKQREVTRILDGLQNQELDLEKYNHLHENIQYDRFINKKELAKLNQLIEIIKDVEDLIQNQWQKRPDVEKKRQEQLESEEMDQEILSQLNEVPIIEQFDLTKFSLKHILLKNKEYLIFAIFILVPIVLLLNSCCKSSPKKDKKKSEKNEKKDSTKSNPENEEKEEKKKSSEVKKSNKTEKNKSKKE